MAIGSVDTDYEERNQEVHQKASARSERGLNTKEVVATRVIMSRI